jgi:replicative DNA helicase
MNALYSDNDAIDMITVSARLRSMNKLELVGGDYVLIELTQKIATSAYRETC